MFLSGGGARRGQTLCGDVRGGGSLVTWQATRMQEYRYRILLTVSSAFAVLGIFRPMQLEKPPAAGSFDAWVLENLAAAPDVPAKGLPAAGAATGKKH